jgi:hypothetical protein
MTEGMKGGNRWTRTSQSRMLRVWAQGEIGNPRWATFLSGVHWPHQLKAKIDIGNWSTLTENEWELVEGVLCQFRAPLLQGILALSPDWYEGAMTIQEIAEVRFMRFGPFLQKVSWSRRLADLAAAHEASASTSEFIRSPVMVPPIIVGSSLERAFTLLEGFTRCTSALRDHASGHFDGLPIPVVVGISERMECWNGW